MSVDPKLVRDIMTTTLITVSPEDDLGEAMARMADAGSHHLPVVRERAGRGEVEVVGMISDRDLRLASNSPYLWGTSAEIVDALRGLRVADVMSGEVVSIFPSATVGEAARLLLTRRIGALPVIEQELGRPFLVGIVTQSDILQHVVDVEPDTMDQALDPDEAASDGSMEPAGD